jgi:hypothetical protein
MVSLKNKSKGFNSNAECSASGTTDDTACDTFTVAALLEGGSTQYSKKSN